VVEPRGGLYILEKRKPKGGVFRQECYRLWALLNALSVYAFSSGMTIRLVLFNFRRTVMKKKLFLSGILGMALVFAIAVISCDNDDGDEEKNTDPKTLVITNISQELAEQGQSGIRIFITPVGATLAQISSGEVGRIAWATSDEPESVTLSGSTCTAQLYVIDDSDNPTNRWTGSGNYDVIILLTGGGNGHFYQKQNVSFTSASTSVNATTFVEVYPPQ
jgi:hypothetical protein